MIEDFSPNPEGPVLVIGSAGVDVVGRVRGELDMGTSNPAQIRMSFGGVARNVAENLARLGQAVTLVTAVGEDAFGDRLLRQTAETGVDVGQVVRTPNFPTGSYLGVIGARGDLQVCLLYTSPSPRDRTRSRMPSSA